MSSQQDPNPNYQAPQYPSRTQYGYQGEPPLWAPYYGAPFKAAVQRVFKKYATFSGRASRAEYWWWALVSGVVGIVLNIITGAGMVNSTDAYGYSAPTPGPVSIVGYILLIVWGLAIIVPSLALTIRRLHDVNMSGWMVLLGLIPFIGGIIVLAFTLLPPKPEGQRFDVPLGPPTA
ncbi:hypothetical protein GCM10027449_15300 [Sinomonas notoginsengisoli]|uniref:DUF805 domain-containing protein n=1 Tax=Sinomonas notoginsengisoli TaxID=1457311 RepID=UPI001F3C5C8B|nr:DUF805 domain-containing protein [Sinomonas notoginsengisoli]